MDRQLATQLDWKVLTDEVCDVIDFGIQQRWFFRRMEGKGVIEKPVLKPDWVYYPIEADSTTIPKEGLQRLEAVKAKVCIKQVIIGHELVEAPVAKPKPEIKIPDVPWRGIATVAVGLAVAGIVGALVVASIPVVAVASAATLVMADPSLIIVLDDQDETWIAIYEWLEESA